MATFKGSVSKAVAEQRIERGERARGKRQTSSPPPPPTLTLRCKRARRLELKGCGQDARSARLRATDSVPTEDRQAAPVES